MNNPQSYSFSEVPAVGVNRTRFKRDHNHKTTFNAGDLVPIYVDDVLPGDTFDLRLSALARLATPKKPIMDDLFLDTFFFAVPLRLLWANFKRFMANEQSSPTQDNTSLLTPQSVSPAGGYAVGSLQDYMGIPPSVAGLSHNVFYTRAYNLIWNTWFRDQNLQPEAPFSTGDGPDTVTDYTLLKRGKRHDYFTSCLPWPQKGPQVLLPLGQTAPVVTTGAQPKVKIGGNAETGLIQVANVSGANSAINSGQNISGTFEFGSITGLQADLATATSASINDLRLAIAIQQFYERDARGGTRYIEWVNSHFGVRSPDERMQRPEFLGGGTVPIVVNPVVQNSATVSGQTPQGNLAAYGSGVVGNHGFVKSFTEHCVIIGLACVRSNMTYQEGLNRHFSKRTRLDFYAPVLAHLGEQAVLNREIFAQGTTADAGVFGYNERWTEYKYMPSRVSGLFRSNASGSLDSWHLAFDYTSLPALNSSFIVEQPPVNRVVQVTTEPQFIMDAYFNLSCVRPMPMYSTPGLERL